MTTPVNPKVSESFAIDETLLAKKAGVNEYWRNSHLFWLDVKDRTIASLSVTDRIWLDRIEHDLTGF